MIARDNHARELLNQAARERLKRDGTLPQHGVVVGRREYAPGDRVIARRNDRARDIDNGTLGTVIDIDTRNRRMLLQPTAVSGASSTSSTSASTSNTLRAHRPRRPRPP